MTSDDSWVGDAQPYLTPRAPGERDAWSTETAARGRRGGQRLLAVEEALAPTPVQTFFDIAPDQQVFVRRRLILLDGRAVELADSYYPRRIAHGTSLAKPGKIPGGAVTLLAQLGFVPEENPLEDVAAATATGSQCDALDLPTNAPVLVLTRFTRSTTGEPVEVSIMTMTRHLQYRQQKRQVN
ncbi:UTRA domain-containing protein [Streptomyces decoyicus]|uniref:UTRA domain-containing protein n=1 Tax=Streptomyces decoyicus TaxID=249567 RepID=UPI0037F309ED